ncbi:MAG: phage Gp37/Gp68 family protein [Prevotella sp.]|nr:phage Gp37/Gp68 family protein [Prevotella sp.]
MHDIWNPWHGCKRKSEGCDNCYMMYLDQVHGIGDGTRIYKTKSYSYPLARRKDGTYKIQSGEVIRVCMNSDFFIEEADIWRNDVWKIIRLRSDVIFILITKRPERILDCLPTDWKNGYENVMLYVTCETQKRADERLSILEKLPFQHKGIMLAPLLEKVDISQYIRKNSIDKVVCGGENYGGNRICDYDWVLSLYEQCKIANTDFIFTETGTYFMKDHHLYQIKSKIQQSKMAYRSGLFYKGHTNSYHLFDRFGRPISEEMMHIPQYTSINCDECGSRPICNGCAKCGKCMQKEE